MRKVVGRMAFPSSPARAILRVYMTFDYQAELNPEQYEAVVITSYSIHYTKLYEGLTRNR